MLNFFLDRINTKAPYKVLEQTEGTLSFTTDNGLCYDAGFVEDYSFMEEGVFQFFISERSGKRATKDMKVKETVVTIIEAFFEYNEYALLYICDTSDGKQQLRNRLFEMWYNTFSYKKEYTRLSASIMVEDVSFYASVIIKNSNKNFALVSSEFNRFVVEIHDKLE